MKTLTLNEMENVNGGLPCWAAKVALVAAGIAFVASEGLILVAAAAIGLGLGEWEFLGACFPEMMS
jgi:hypothetical protein